MDTASAWLVWKLYPPIPSLRRPGPPVFLGEASHATMHHGWGSASSLRETLSPSKTQTNTNSPVKPSLSSPPSLSPAHSPPNSPISVQSPLPLLKNTPTYNRASIQLHKLIYLKQHTRPLDVSREGVASAGQVERTHGRATLTSWVVRPLHSHTQEGWVDNNNHKQVIYQLSYTNKNTCAQNREKLLSLMMCQHSIEKNKPINGGEREP